MERLPFDPKKVPSPPKSKEKPARRDRKRLSNVADARQMTVSQLAEVIKSTLEQKIPSPLRVVGEVSNLSDRGHWYFSLKDDRAVIGCVAWSSSAKKFGFTPSDGDEVVATGHVSHYEPQGRTQLYVSKLEPVGAGALEIAFRKMCAELRNKGYFDPAHKIPLPVFPRKIAVITSRDGAAVQDVIATARQRCPAVSLAICDVRVQGDGAAAEVANAIRWVDANRHRLGVDAILVTRGGGSIEDLWAFNERIVADAAYDCELPIVAAIGHESDTTVIELVADVRAATPTQAAMRLVPSREELNRQLAHQRDRLTVVTRRRVEHGRHRLEGAARHETFRRPELIVQRARERLTGSARHLQAAVRQVYSAVHLKLEQLAGRLALIGPQAIVWKQHEKLAVLEDRLRNAARHRIDQRPRITQLQRSLRAAHRHVVRSARLRADSIEQRLVAVDPLRVLERGFSVTQRQDGSVVRSAGDVTGGDRVVTRVVDGAFASVVEGQSSRATPQAAGDERTRGTEGSRSKVARAKPPATADLRQAAEGGNRQESDQMDLFGDGQ